MKDSLKIRLLRHRIQKDQHQMAEKMNISVAEYSRIETGIEQLSHKKLEQLTNIFGLSTEDFLNYSVIV